MFEYAKFWEAEPKIISYYAAKPYKDANDLVKDMISEPTQHLTSIEKFIKLVQGRLTNVYDRWYR